MQERVFDPRQAPAAKHRCRTMPVIPDPPSPVGMTREEFRELRRGDHVRSIFGDGRVYVTRGRSGRRPDPYLGSVGLIGRGSGAQGPTLDRRYFDAWALIRKATR